MRPRFRPGVRSKGRGVAATVVPRHPMPALRGHGGVALMHESGPDPRIVRPPTGFRAMSFAKSLALSAAVATAGVVVPALPAAAQTVVVEAFNTVNRFDVTGAALEYRFAPFREKNGTAMSVILRGMYDEGDNGWLGAGLHIRHDYASGWFVEGATMPGYYDHSAPQYYLGSHLEFFSYVGVGRQVSDANFVSVMFGHLSNANTGDINPGRNSVSVRFGTRF